MVALAIITLISLVVMGALSPWVNFKQKLDTERRLQDVRQGMLALYEQNGMTIEEQPAGQFLNFRTSAANAGQCPSQEAAFATVTDSFSESSGAISRDGYNNPWCLIISAPISERRDGVDLWFRNMFIISPGVDGLLDAATAVGPDGNLKLGGDDMGVTVSGRDVQWKKAQETFRRLSKVAQMYETYFTTRYLANVGRDISIYYFSNQYDTGGAVASTSGNWRPVSTALSAIGVSGSDTVTPWESNNAIEVGNATESLNGSSVRSPATTGVGTLPYTSLLRARLPAPTGQTSFAVKVVVGNY